MRPLDGINKDVGGTKLLLTTMHLCLSCGLCLFLSLTEGKGPLSICVLMEAVTRLQLPTYPHPPHTYPLIHTTHDITVALKKVAQNSAVLAIANRGSYKTIAK